MSGASASAFTDFGGAAQDIFGAVGDFAEAGSYRTAAKLAEQNAKISQESAAIQEFQASRQIGQVVGQQQAEVGSAGLRESGSSLDLLRSSMSQGALTKSLIEMQGQINVNGYEAQASAYSGMASAATAGGIGGIVSGIFKAAAGAAMMGF